MNSEIQQLIDRLFDKYPIDFIALATAEIEPRTGLKEIKWEFVSGNQSQQYKKIRLQIGKGIGGIVWRTGRPYLASGLQTDKTKLMAYPIARMEKLEVVFAFPLMSRERVISVVLVGNRENREFPPNVLDQIQQEGDALTRMLEGRENGE